MIAKQENPELLLNQRLLEVVRASIRNTPGPKADRRIYEEMKAHRIEALAAPILSSLSLPEDLYHEWEHDILRQVYHWYRYCGIQSSLPISLPYVILKGTSAAQYYPYPEYRTMGDIDIMTRHEDFHAACEMLLQNGFEETTDKNDARVRNFQGNGIQIEIHRFYALRHNVEETRLLDQLIFDHFNESHILPDPINGLTLIEHINHHLEGGLGLRQILDWYMFADKCLSDDAWPAFRAIAQRTGHERLAIIVTRMCELYLGLPQHRWCADADEQVCEELMSYILASGNFGRKKSPDYRTSMEALSRSNTLQGAIQYLTRRGMMNWKAAQKYPILRPIACIYQLNRYLFKGLFRKGSIGKFKDEVAEAKRLEKLFDSVGIPRSREGRVIYKDGEYKIKSPF